MERGYEAYKERNSGGIERIPMTEKSYIQMLEESLGKKCDILRQLQVLCYQQADILQDDKSPAEAFEQNVEEKAVLIRRLEQLDQGFEQIFARVQEDLESNKEQYKDSICHMQERIREITERSANLQMLERQNRDLAKKRFASVRTQARELRQNGKVVGSYYQNMMKAGTVEPHFMDSKK